MRVPQEEGAVVVVEPTACPITIINQPPVLITMIGDYQTIIINIIINHHCSLSLLTTTKWQCFEALNYDLWLFRTGCGMANEPVIKQSERWPTTGGYETKTSWRPLHQKQPLWMATLWDRWRSKMLKPRWAKNVWGWWFFDEGIINSSPVDWLQGIANGWIFHINQWSCP